MQTTRNVLTIRHSQSMRTTWVFLFSSQLSSAFLHSVWCINSSKLFCLYTHTHSDTHTLESRSRRKRLFRILQQILLQRRLFFSLSFGFLSSIFFLSYSLHMFLSLSLTHTYTHTLTHTQYSSVTYTTNLFSCLVFSNAWFLLNLKTRLFRSISLWLLLFTFSPITS